MYGHLLLSIRSKESQVWIRPSASVQIWSNSEAVPARLHWLYSFRCKRPVLVWGQPFYVKVSEIAEISTYCADSSWLTFWTCRLQTCLTFCHARSEAHTIWHPTYRFSNVSKSSCRKMSLWRNTVDAQLEKFVVTHDSQKGCLAQFFGPTTESGHVLQVYQRYHHLALLFSWIPIYCTVGEQTCRPLWKEAGEGSFT